MPQIPPESESAYLGPSLNLHRLRIISGKDRILVLLASSWPSSKQREILNRLLSFDFEVQKRIESKTQTHERKTRYILSALDKWETAVNDIEKASNLDESSETVKIIKEHLRLVERLEELVDNIMRDKNCKPNERKMLESVLKELRGLNTKISKGVYISSIDRVNSKLHLLKQRITPFEENLSKRARLSRLGVKAFAHNIFDKYPLRVILAVNKLWRTKDPAKLSAELNIEHEDLIALARALGWPVIPESLEWWRNKYQIIELGKPLDVTYVRFSDAPSIGEANSNMIRDGLKAGKKIFAIPIYNGRGCLRKWDVYGDSLAVDLEGRLELTASPHGVVAAWLCSHGEGVTHNIGYDEFSVIEDGSMEGIPVKTAHALHRHLSLGQNDSYILMVRNPKEIDRDFEELRLRLESIIKNGGSAKRQFAKVHQDYVENIRLQVHPHIEEEMVLEAVKQFRDYSRSMNP